MLYSRQNLGPFLRRAFWILFSWVLIANVLFFYEYFTLQDHNALTSAYDFLVAFQANLLVSTVAGIIGGTLTVNFMERSLRKYAFAKALTIIIGTYIIGAYIISFVGSIFYYSDYLGAPLFSPEVLAEVREFFTSWLFLKSIIVWLFIVLGTLIVLMINDKYGPGVFPDYLKGRYFRPKKEHRIFMFADIRNATGIAEDVGELKYFNFLKDFFKDIAPAIQRYRGEVYQYVGDEVVLTWKMHRGLKKSNTIKCYYRMRRDVRKRRDYYLKTYGHVPEFKVGIHCGSVMVGELGTLKRDIAFSGDVLNTTARIQDQCNTKGHDILASTTFSSLLTELPKGVRIKALGDELLKGKSEEVAIVTFERG